MADGSETPALRASGNANAELLHARLQSRSLQAKTRCSAVRTRHDPIALLESSQDLLALRLFQRFANVAGQDCRTQADEDGKARNPLTSAGYANRIQFLQAWREQQAQIVASSPASLAIANSIPPAPVPVPSARRTLADRLGFFFRRQPPEIWHAPSLSVPPAASGRADTENTGFPLLSEMERRVR